MKTARQGAHVDSLRELELAVVSGAEQRRIDQVLLGPGEILVRRDEVPLLVIAETGYPAEVG